MREPKDFVVELRADVAHMPHHPYTADLITRAADEIERLRAAIFWALGEDKDADGKWFGEAVPEGDKLPPYWWRKNLRKLAGLASYSYDKERRTLTRDPEQTPT